MLNLATAIGRKTEVQGFGRTMVIQLPFLG